jgi:hypothetical protein
VPATKLAIKDNLSDDESKRGVTLQIKTDFLPVPPPGSDSDPRCNGAPSGTVKATLSLASTGSGAATTSPLPCQNWSLVGKDENPQGYKYADKTLSLGTVSKLSWRRNRDLKATLTGKGGSTLAYDLQVGIAQNPVHAEIVSGTVGLCIECATVAHDGSDGKRFAAKGVECPAPPACNP